MTLVSTGKSLVEKKVTYCQESCEALRWVEFHRHKICHAWGQDEDSLTSEAYNSSHTFGALHKFQQFIFFIDPNKYSCFHFICLVTLTLLFITTLEFSTLLGTHLSLDITN